MSAPPRSSPSGRALFVAIAGSSMASLDATVVNVALPIIQRKLGASLDAVQWMVEAYALLLASLVLVGGALGDRLGRKRVFLAGVIVFALSSAACGAAPGAWLLVAARAVQGVGAALLVPGSLALIGSAYEGPARDRAIGIWSASGAITGAIGPVVGGWVVAHGSWRWLFLFNVPLALVILAVARGGVAETRDSEAAPRTDVAGASLVTLGLGLLVYALIDHGAHTGAAGSIALYIGGALALVSFLVVEARAPSPMVDLSLFRRPVFAGTNLLTLLLYGALGGAFFFLPFELIQIRGYSPTQAGATLLPCIVCIAGLSPFAGSLASAHGPRVLLTVGPLLAGAGFLLLALLPGDEAGSYWTTYFPGVVVLGVGMGLTVAPLTAAVMGSVEARHSGVASGVNNAIARAAALLAIAAFGGLVRARFDASFDAGIAGLRLAPGLATLAPELAERVASERARLGGADFSGLDPALAGQLREVTARAYVAGVRAVMTTSAVLAAVSAAGAVLFLRGALRRGLTSGAAPSSSTEVTDDG